MYDTYCTYLLALAVTAQYVRRYKVHDIQRQQSKQMTRFLSL
jgi:hypothetical protein